MLEATFNPTEAYFSYLAQQGVKLDSTTQGSIQAIIESTNWDEPTTGLDFNNCAVMALIQAESAQDSGLGETYLGLATEYLAIGLDDYPLCLAHQLMMQLTLTQVNWQYLLQTYLGLLQDTYSQTVSPGLVYLPTFFTRHSRDLPNIYNSISHQKNGYHQCLLILLTTLISHTVFYNQLGVFLAQLSRLIADHSSLRFRIGVASAMMAQSESIAYLHGVQANTPENPYLIQALYLVYRGLGQQQRGEYWREFAQNLNQDNPDLDWAWVQVDSSVEFTYLKFDQDICLAVEPSLQSIVTSVLLVEGDWFEFELDWWRAWLKPGMTVIDVGANAGVYTFSAAKRVGSTGKVIAIEPFNPCTKLLQQTKTINHFDQVEIYQAAASDRQGLAYLSIKASSELNELITITPGQVIPPNALKIDCLTLDSLLETAQVSSVEILKIDAEGHELQVLQGAETIIATFRPTILYENISGLKLASRDVNEFLIQHGYQLLTYNPLLQQLVPITDQSISQPLNIIAQAKVK